MATEIQEIFELKFEGGGINPDAIRASEVAELIVSFERTIIASLREQFPDIDTKQYAYLSFSKIEDESLGLKFLAKKAIEAFLATYISITTNIKDNTYNNLPIPAIEELQTISRFTKKYNCKCDYIHNGERLAQFTPETVVGINEEYILKGETTIYGRILRAGGVEPRIEFSDHSDQRIYFKVSQENAKRLAKRLYEDVALSGIATWDKKSYRVLDFKITEITDLEKKPLTQTFAEIQSVIGKYWDKIDNPESLIDD